MLDRYPSIYNNKSNQFQHQYSTVTIDCVHLNSNFEESSTVGVLNGYFGQQSVTYSTVRTVHQRTVLYVQYISIAC